MFSIKLRFLLGPFAVWFLSPLSAETVPAPITFEAAIAATLAETPGVRLELSRAEQAAGTAESAAGAFDWYGFSQVSRQQDVIPLDSGSGVDHQRSDALNAVMGFSRRLRSGVNITPSLGMNVSENNTDTPVGDTRTELRLEVSMPLLRGLGSVATADERSAQLAAEATRGLAAHRIAEQVTYTAVIFWQTLEASRNAAILADSERQASKLFGIIERLVNGGEIPSRTLLEAKADLLRRQADRISAEAGLYARQQTLAGAIGLSPDAFAYAPIAVGDFPAVIAADALPPNSDPRVVRWALTQREDLGATQLQIQAQSIQLARARDNLKPRLDLNLRGTYSGLAEDSGITPDLSAYTNRLTGPGAYVSLRLKWPVGNQAAHGQWRRQKAVVDEAEATAQRAAQGVAADALTSLRNLHLQATLVNYAQQTVDALSGVVSDERNKVTNGESSITNLIQIEDRFLQARLLHNSARSAFAQSLAQFRRATASLVRSDQDRLSLSSTDLTSLPVIPEL